MISFKKPSKQTKSISLDEHPHIGSLSLWNDLYGSVEKRYQKSRMLNIGLVALLAISVMGLIHLGSKSKFEPWLVSFDGTSPMNVGSIQKQDINKSQKGKLAEFYIKDFIKNAREISVDGAIDKQKITKSYSFANQAALTHLKDYLSANNKYEIATDKTVNIEKFSYVLGITKDTYKAKWLEVIRDSGTGNKLLTKAMVGEFQVSWEKPSKNAVIFQNNPLGFYITNFSWVGEN